MDVTLDSFFWLTAPGFGVGPVELWLVAGGRGFSSAGLFPAGWEIGFGEAFVVAGVAEGAPEDAAGADLAGGVPASGSHVRPRRAVFAGLAFAGAGAVTGSASGVGLLVCGLVAAGSIGRTSGFDLSVRVGLWFTTKMTPAKTVPMIAMRAKLLHRDLGDEAGGFGSSLGRGPGS